MAKSRKSGRAVWVEVKPLAACLKCSAKYLRNHGHMEHFGFKRGGPRKYLVCLPEAVKFYTAEFPDVEIDRKRLEALAQSKSSA